MPETSVIPSMWYAHSLYNTVIFLFFVWQAWLGSKIRIQRLSGIPTTMAVIKRHRKLGSVVTLLGIAGFLTGVVIVYIGGGHMVARPLHLIVGSVLTVSIIASFLISRKIKGPASPWRTPHFAAGTATICLYIIQIYIGINILS